MFKKEPPKHNNASKYAIGAALTALAGYVAGLLTAPKSGRETRKDVKDQAERTYATAEKELKKLHTELNDVLNEVGDKVSKLRGNAPKEVDDILSKGTKAKDKAREVLSGLHDGDIEDKDLKNAVAEATKAIENLRNFLKK